MEKTKAFVVRYLKYGDSGLIMHFYTREFGMQSFIFKGFYKSKNKNRALLFPMTEMELSFTENKRSDLKYAKNLQTLNAFADAHSNPVKSIILQMLTEVLYSILKQDEPNAFLYDFIVKQVDIFNNKKENFADFHLVLLLNLTSFLGFFPNTEKQNLSIFDLEEGDFSDSQKSPFSLSEQETLLWKKLIDANFDEVSLNIFNQSQRKELLNILLKYYQLHLPGFREPKSLEVIKVLF